MPHVLGMIHTVSGLLPLFNGLADELMPDVKRFHIADEGLLRLVWAANGISPAVYHRLGEDVVCARQAGADAIVVTCSSISPCVDTIRAMVDVPVLKIDEAMADKASELGRRICVVATATTTLGPTSDLVQARAALAGREVQVEPVLCTGAYEALMGGDLSRHDAIVVDFVRRAMARADVVVIAQASMARAVDTIPAAERMVPLLSSPRLGMERVCQVLHASPAA